MKNKFFEKLKQDKQEDKACPDQEIEQKVETRERGAITIFLSVILIPLLMLTFLFVDISRYSLASGVVSSAADLALNSALANFDGPLLDHYGLMATSLNATPGTIRNDTEKEFAYNISIHGDGDGGKGDLLRLKTVDYDLNRVEGSNLANPGVLKMAIVDFMRYRSPINNLIEVIKYFTEGSEVFKRAEGDAELAEKQKVTYEELEDVSEKLYKVYYAVDRYEKLEPEFP